MTRTAQPFKLICVNCDTVGIKIDDEIAEDTVIVRCSNCGCERGTLGGLRKLELEMVGDDI